jgi:hypothetical protein
MNETFTRMHRHLGQTLAWVLYGALATYGLALIGALLGLPHMVVSFRGAAASLAAVFLGLFVLFLLSTLIAAILRRLKTHA